MCSKIIVLFVVLLALGASALPTEVKATTEYYFSTEATSFVQAWAYCKNAGMKFLSVTSAAQDNALQEALDELGAPTTTFWIGGLYMNEGFLQKWYWVDGLEDFNYVNWASTPTPPATVDNCVLFSYTATTKKGVWSYGTCVAARYFICET